MRTFFGERRGRAAKILAVAVLLLAIVAAAGVVVMLLWNWLMPALFSGAHPVDYWQALGLLVLSKILFGGRSFHGKARPHWEGMTGEEREQLKRHFKSRWDAHWGGHGGQE